VNLGRRPVKSWRMVSCESAAVANCCCVPHLAKAYAILLF
jgi:hypothetical protein